MRWITTSWQWIRSIGRRRTLESGLDEEIRFHIDQQTEKNRRAGMRPDEARRQALLKFGGLERVRESTRDEIRPALLEDSVRDLRHGVRVLRRAPGFTVAALVTLALGIGATSAIFSVVRTVMLEPLPYHQPGSDRRGVGDQPRRHQPERDRPGQLRRLARAHANARPSGHGGPGRRGDDHQRPAARRFQASPSRPTSFARWASSLRSAAPTPPRKTPATPVIVLSHEFWQRRLGGRRDVLGMTIPTDDGPRTVDRRDASRLHRRRSESRLPGSLRSDAGAASRRARPRQLVRHRAPARRGLVRAGLQRDAKHLRRPRERGAAAQCPPDGDALPTAGADGRRAPACAVRAGGRGRARAARGLRQRRQSAAGAERRARARARHANGAWREPRPAGAPDAHRKSGARGRRRHRWAVRSRRCVIAACSRWSAIAFRFRGSTRWRSICRWSRSRWSSRWRPASSSVSSPRSSRRAPRAMRCAKADVTAAAAGCTACSARWSSPKWRCRSCCWPAPAC